MIVLIGAFLVSMIPAAFMFFWLRDKVRQPSEEEFKTSCNDAFVKGLLSTFPVVAGSAILSIIGALLGLRRDSSILGAAYYTFIVLALVEELCKVFMCTRVLKKTKVNYTWLDIIIFMTIVSIGFEVLESVIYAFGTGPIHMIVRGVTLMHGGFGFIEGWFMGKGKYTGNKMTGVIGILIAWILHGAYDFGLSEIFLEVGDWSAMLSVSIAILSLILFIYMIIFFAKKSKKPQYLEPVRTAEE